MCLVAMLPLSLATFAEYIVKFIVVLLLLLLVWGFIYLFGSMVAQ